MSGGSGKRFWPASFKEKPKQFLPVVGKKTILERTYERIKGYFKPENIFICSGIEFSSEITKLLNISKEQLILEPISNDTLSAFLYSVLKIRKKLGKRKIGIFPCDHFIPEEKLFFSQLDKIFERISDDKNELILKGIPPSYASSLYGYIETSPVDDNGFCTVKSFREKPSRDKAEEYLRAGNYFWNGGMLFFSSDVFESICNEIDSSWSENLLKYIDTGDVHYYEENPSISFDYAVLEKTENLMLMKGEYYWNDIGSWEAALEIHLKFGLDILGFTPQKDSSGNWIITDGHIPVNTIGIENSLIVVLKSGILISKFGESHRIKNLI